MPPISAPTAVIEAAPGAAAPKRRPLGRRRPSALVATTLLALSAAACGGVATSLQNGVLAPLTALKSTDVVLETNLETAVVAHREAVALGTGTGTGCTTLPSSGVSAGAAISSLSGGGAGGGGCAPSGGAVASGTAPASESAISQASNAASTATVFSAYNPLTRHCLGTLVVEAAGTTAPVLGETGAGSYDFWFGPTSRDSCAADALVAMATAPSAWGANDPSATGFPST